MDRVGVPQAVQELRRQLVVRDRLGGVFHRWGSFCALLVFRYLRRLAAANLPQPFWARCVFHNARAIADANADDSDFDSDPKLSEYLANRASPY